MFVKRLIVSTFLRFMLWLRYRIKVKGLETLDERSLSKPGGILFLANHPAEIDPCILVQIFWPKFQIRPVAVDYLFQNPIVRSLLKFVGAFPIPSFEGSSNSYKRHQIEETFNQVQMLLAQRENLLIYPAGGLKRGESEVVGGASGAYRILQNNPDINVVLIRTTGLWGSSFSRAQTGKSPKLAQAFGHGLKVLLKNLIFFAPRREVLVECELAPKDFPWKGKKLELNLYLEQWYNKYGEEPLNLVSYSCFRKELPTVYYKPPAPEVDLSKISEEIKSRVIEEIAQLSPAAEVTSEKELARDLGFDSLDMAQIVTVLKEHFGAQNVLSTDLTTVKSVMGYASLQIKNEAPLSEETPEGVWGREARRPGIHYPDSETLIEGFLQTCDRMDGFLACTDAQVGELSYRRMKLAVIVVAKMIKKLPGERIGVMLPASAAVNILILAIQLVGKVPVMINWTLGRRNLESVLEQAQVEAVISSWKFLNRLENIELDGLDDRIVLFEELKDKSSFWVKAQGWWMHRKKAKSVLRAFGAHKIKHSDSAVILFTSGTESIPKGVPLSHLNIMSNHRSASKAVNVQDGDIFLGALPPFHSFGFSVTGLFPLIAGLPVAYFANPTDGRGMAKSIERWGVTMVCMAPTFLKNMLRVGRAKQLHTLRLVVSGAEKMPQELVGMLQKVQPMAQIIEGYGITECAPILTLNPPSEPPAGVGKPLPLVHLKIVEPETLAPKPLGEPGLILAHGPNIFKGYLDPKLPSPFVQVDNRSWYNTGDIGFLDERGHLTISGRLKRFVKIGGEMISLGAVEEVLLQKAEDKNDDAIPLAICAHEVEGKKSTLHLFTVFEMTKEEANAHLKECGMSNLVKIQSVMCLPFIPVLGSGKVDYQKLLTHLHQ